MHPASFQRLVRPSPGALSQLWQRLRTPIPFSGNLTSSSSSSTPPSFPLSPTMPTLPSAFSDHNFNRLETEDNDRLRLPYKPNKKRSLSGGNHSSAAADILGHRRGEDGDHLSGVMEDRLRGRGTHLPRLMSLDVGWSYVGVALSDPGGLRVRPHSVINRRQRTDGRHIPVDKFGTTKGLYQQQLGQSNSNRHQARPAPTKAIPDAEVASELRGLVEEHNVCALVVGLPLPPLEQINSEQAYDRCHMVWNWVEAVRQAGQLELPIFWVSEIFSTQFAKMQLRESGYRTQEVDRRLDQEAAAIILRRFLDDLCEAAREQ